MFLEGIEASRRHHKSPEKRDCGEKIDTQAKCNFLAVSLCKRHHSLGFRPVVTRGSFSRIQDQVRIVHGPKSIRVIRLVLLDICSINPMNGLHEAMHTSVMRMEIGERSGSYISSSVGVKWPVRVIRRKGTCKTDFDKKAKPFRS